MNNRTRSILTPYLKIFAQFKSLDTMTTIYTFWWFYCCRRRQVIILQLKLLEKSGGLRTTGRVKLTDTKPMSQFGVAISCTQVQHFVITIIKVKYIAFDCCLSLRTQSPENKAWMDVAWLYTEYRVHVQPYFSQMMQLTVCNFISFKCSSEQYVLHFFFMVLRVLYKLDDVSLIRKLGFSQPIW